MGMTIVIVFAVIGLIFIASCTAAPSMKKKLEEANSLVAEKKCKVSRTWQKSPVAAVFVCGYKDGSIVLPEGESLAFVRKDVSKVTSPKVYLPEPSSNSPKVEIPVYCLRSGEENVDVDRDRVVEPLYWITPNLMVGRILDGERRAIVRCTKEDFNEVSFTTNVGKEVDCGYGYEEYHYDAKVVSVREELVQIVEVCLKK